jgi:uncharacterized protein YjbI with pentapeptide repeats
MSQPMPPEPTNNHRSETELPVFVKRGKLWIPDTAKQRSLIQRIWNWTGFKEKKLWDVFQLAVLPIVVVLIANIFQETAKQRDLIIAQANREQDQRIADNRTNQETLNRYFDQISALLFERKLRTAKEGDEAQIVARAITLSALRELDGQRRGQLIDFLIEAKLIDGKVSGIELSNAELSGVTLRGRRIQNAVIVWGFLDGADFRGSDFSGANLTSSKFRKADLRATRFESVNLRQAVFDGADLRGAFLRSASLDQASFENANLQGAKVDSKALQSVYLCNTTLPDGTKSDRDCDKLKQRNQK